MELTFDVDEDDGEILSIYIRLQEGEITRTEEVSPGECYADVSGDGTVLGIEMVEPARFEANAAKAATQFNIPQIRQAVNSMRKAFAAA